MTISNEAELSTFPQVREDPLRPAKIYEQWREEGPARRVMLQSGKSAWVVLRHKEAREILESPNITRDPSLEAFPEVRAGSSVLPRKDLLVSNMDPPLHGKFRRMFAPWFAPKRINQLRPGIQQLVDDTIDQLLTLEKPADFHREFSLVVPSTVVCQQLGIDYAYHHDFERLAAVTTSSTADMNTFKAAAQEMFELVNKIVDEEMEHPGDGLLNMFVTAFQEGQISRDQLVSNTRILIVGGHETTAHTISLGLIQLWREPDKLAWLRANPEAIPGVIDEMIRVQSIADAVMMRVTTEEFDFGDVKIPAGEGVIPLTSPANFDPRAFEDPYTFKLERDDKSHVGLGGGIHACLGMTLARAELEIVFETLLRRLPTLRLAGGEDDVVFSRDGFVSGVRSMPVTW
ncbi:cytochrome P450 [Salinibacterium sp. ZJ454]|uniref:cytochrome P450 n=1 Tax=Salinibacterium sp. ZJ454 TaxID=2708339 RepID=UPI001422A862|nr:cytochrome P450 [Salinibacterium sp. ZJ454]